MASRGPRLELRRLERLVAGFERRKLLVIGDVMLDEYLSGDVDRISPEAPIPVVHVHRESVALGGAANVARNAVAMGAQCVVCAVVGSDAGGDRLIDLMKELGVDPSGMVRVEGRPTTRKTRVEARTQQIVRFDRETDEGIPPVAVRALARATEEVLPLVDGVVLEDYGKGVLTPAVVRGLMKRFLAAGTFVAVDPKDHVAAYRGASFVKPNLREVEQLVGHRLRDRDELDAAAASLRRKLAGSPLVVTRGAQGMTIYAEGEPQDAPIAQSEVFDVQGAGDTSIAALALACLAGGSLLEAAVIANAAAAVVVGKVGTATATPDEIRSLLPAALDAVRRSGGRA